MNTRILARWDTFLSAEKFEALEKKLVVFSKKQANKGKAPRSMLYCLLNNIFKITHL